MKWYLAFSYYQHYPVGGMHDCIGKFNTLEEAKAALRNADGEYRHIYDAETETFVEVIAR